MNKMVRFWKQFWASFLLFDILRDREARPTLIYATFILLLGATLYSWLEGWSFLDSIYFVGMCLAALNSLIDIDFFQ